MPHLFLTKRLFSLAFFSKFYFRMISMQIGRGTTIPKIHVTWPHQVKLGADCTIEHDVYSHFDGVYKPRPSILVGDCCFIGKGCEFNVCERVSLGNDCLIGAGTRFIDHDHNISALRPLPKIEGPCDPIHVRNHVWVGANAVILKSVQIVLSEVVAAVEVVTKSIPPNEIWGGVPAKKIGERKQVQI